MQNNKLPNFLLDSKLNQIRTHMQANLIPNSALLKGYGICYEEWQALRTGTLEIDLSQLTIKGNLLFYHNILVSLHLKHSYKHQPSLHLCDCPALQTPSAHYATKTYYISAQTHTKRPFILVNEQRAINAPLSVCKYCLSISNWQGYHQNLNQTAKERIISQFCLAKFNQHYMNPQLLFLLNKIEQDQQEPLH